MSVRAFEAICMVIATIASAIAAIATWRATDSAKALSAEQARYQIRSTALATFDEASTRYDGVLHQIRYSLPVDIEEQEIVKAMTLEQLASVRAVVHPIISARRDYKSKFNSFILPWPKNLRAIIVKSATEGDRVGYCFETAAAKPLNNDEIIQIKNRINAACRNLGNSYSLFVAETDAISDEMSREIASAASVLGADPDGTSPQRTVR